jgi:hypothetical protein
MINLPAAQRLRTGSIAAISFEVAILYRTQLWEMIKRGKTDFWNVKISRPKRPRTIGYKSQNHHVNGHIQQICIETGNTFSAVKERMKELAIDMGYPVETLPDRSVKPISESEIDTVQAGYLIDTIHRFADEWGIRLIEEDEE